MIAGSPVLHIEGNLDVSAAPAVRDAFFDLPAGARIVIDLSDVAFLDSAGLGSLIGGIRRTRERGGEAVICCPRTRLARVIEVAGVTRTVPVLSTVEESFAALAAEDGSDEG